MIGKRLRILHAPTNVGNHAWVLSRAERRLGYVSNVYILYQTWLNYPADIVISKVGCSGMFQLLRRIYYAISGVLTHDIIHYNFGRSLLYWDDLAFKGLPFWDLYLAKLLKKRVYLTLQGCDARIASSSFTRNIVTPCNINGCQSFNYCISTYDNQKLHLIRSILPLCHKVFYLNPEQGHYLPDSAKFLPYSNVDIRAIVPRMHKKESNIIKILHAPSNQAIKGTDKILDALNKLKQTYAIEVILVENMNHQSALEAYQHADLAIDQCLLGWYGGFAVELMAMGIPVMCYLRKEDMKFIPIEMFHDLPIININPLAIEDSIRSILDNKHKLASIGIKSREYVEKWHDPLTVASLLHE